MVRRSALPGRGAAPCLLLFASLVGVTSHSDAQQVVVHEPAGIVFRQDVRMPGVSVAIVAGDPASGPYTMRVKFEPNTRVPAHTHPDDRTVTVLSGNYLFAIGDHFDAAALKSYAAGTVIVVPAGVAHFVASGDAEVVLQESGVGPTGSTVVTGTQ
jgi:quercetin dioxygenase-like cupin family protein